MSLGSLFSGIGGLELGLEKAGLGPTVWQVEQDFFCRAVLAKHWPDADRRINDVRLATARSLQRVQFLCGGFPCQDVSGAGKGAGLAGERSGLWFEFRRIVGELQPEGVIVENVASGKRRWLCQVRNDLHALGYRTRAVQISAADVGAPHLRERIFVLALGDTGRSLSVADSIGVRQLQPSGSEPDERRRIGNGSEGVGVANTFSELVRVESGGGSGPSRSGEAESGDAREMGEPTREGRGRRCGHALAEPRRVGVASDAGGGEAESGMGRVAHGLSAGLDRHRWPSPRGAEQQGHEPPRTVHGKQERRRARLKALGNAVVPQCAYVAGLVMREWMEAS